jgi:hypothetical protein
MNVKAMDVMTLLIEEEKTSDYFMWDWQNCSMELVT